MAHWAVRNKKCWGGGAGRGGVSAAGAALGPLFVGQNEYLRRVVTESLLVMA